MSAKGLVHVAQRTAPTGAPLRIHNTNKCPRPCSNVTKVIDLRNLINEVFHHLMHASRNEENIGGHGARSNRKKAARAAGQSCFLGYASPRTWLGCCVITLARDEGNCTKWSRRV